MCVVSMIMDHYREDWGQRIRPQTTADWSQFLNPQVPAITPAEIAEFRKLLERAREYDARNSEPECELEEKKQAVKLIAQQLGVDISFL